MLLTFELDGVRETVAALLETQPAAKRAAVRATNKTLNWLSTQVAREVAAQYDVPVRAIKAHRVYTRLATQKTLQGELWMGINPIRSGYLKPLRQMKRGARARSHFFEGGFVATMASGHRGIFQRSGKSRLPIYEATVEIGNAGDYAHLEGDAEQRLDTVLAQELNYELNVKGNR